MRAVFINQFINFFQGCIPKVTIPTWARIIQPHYPIRLDQPYSKVNQRFPGNAFIINFVKLQWLKPKYVFTYFTNENLKI